MRQYNVGLKELCPFTEDEHPMDLMNILDQAVRAIQNFTNEIRKKKTSRVVWNLMWDDVYEEWGEYSHLFNKVLRLRIKLLQDDTSPTLEDMRMRLSYVYAYWWNRQYFVRDILSKRSKLSGASRRKGIESGRNTIKACIEGFNNRNISKQFKEVVEMFMQKTYKSEFIKVIHTDNPKEENNG
jgi:hypothetical protein